MAYRIGPTKAAALAAAFVWLAACPVEGAPEHRLTVTADAAGFVDVRLDEGNVIDLERATFRGGRSYAAVVFTRLGALADEDSLLAVRFPGAESAGMRPVVLGHLQTGPDGTAITPGTYRLYLLADGPATVSFPVSRLRRDVTVTASRRVSPRLRVTDIPTPLSPGFKGLYQGGDRHPFAMDGHSYTIYRLHAVFGQGPVERHGAQACDTTTGDECGGPTDGLFLTRVLQAEPDATTITGYVPRDLWPPGTYDVYGSCYALYPVSQCRLVTLDRFVSRAAVSVEARIPDAGRDVAPSPSAAATATARARARPGASLPATGTAGAVTLLASAALAAAVAVRPRRC